jgi:hypothetical protein
VVCFLNLLRVMLSTVFDWLKRKALIVYHVFFFLGSVLFCCHFWMKIATAGTVSLFVQPVFKSLMEYSYLQDSLLTWFFCTLELQKM